MPNISASVPDNLKAWIDTQIQAGNYSSASDYVRDLIRTDQRRTYHIDELLLDGLDSGEPIEVNEDYWLDKKAQLLKKVNV